MVDFRFYLNRQGLRGQQGEKGDTGFSPSIVEEVNTLTDYRLKIINEFDEFVTDNLRGSDYFDITDPNGTYLRFDKESGRAYTGALDQATNEAIGAARLANVNDMETFSENTIVTPALFADNLVNLIVSPDGSLNITQNEQTSKTEITFNSATLDTVRAELNRVKEDLATESQIRLNADNQQQVAIDAERRERETQDAALQAQISSISGNFVTVDTRQNITGQKDFDYITSKNLIVSNGSARLQLTGDNSTLSIKPVGASDDLVIGNANRFNGLTLAALNGVKFEGDTPSIKRGNDYKKILAQDTVEQGENITIEQTDKGIKISSTASGGAIIDDNTPATDKVFSSSKTSDLVGELGNEVNSIAGRLNTLEDEVVVATNEKLGLVKPDGNTITIDSDGKISAVGGGGSVDIDNKTIKKGSDGKLYVPYANELAVSMSTKYADDGSEFWLSNFKIPIDSRVSSDGTLHYGQIVFEDPYGTQVDPLVSFRTIKAGNNVTIEKNIQDGTITFNCTGGGSEGGIKTVNNVEPDENGNVDVTKLKGTGSGELICDNPSYLVKSATKLIRINTRDYVKNNNIPAFCAYYVNNEGWIFALLVSNQLEATYQHCTEGGEYNYLHKEEFDYKGIHWYATVPDFDHNISYWPSGTSTDGVAPKLTEIYATITDAAKALLDLINGRENITYQFYTKNEIDDKIKEVELFKFPNATIEGDPTINNGQISNFSTTNYLRFPFEFKTEGRTWLLNGSFDTKSDVTTQQNIIDSLASVALAVRNGRLVLALSTNGTSFDLGEHSSMSDILPNTKYYYRLSFSGTQYLLSISTDKQEWLPEIIITSDQPIASRPMTISSSGHPFGGIINLNDYDLTVANTLVWQGMDDVGIASRMDVNASNATDSAKDVMLNTNGLESGKSQTSDPRLFNEILDRERSTFDLSKFTVIGNPTITDDGIASGFSSTRRLFVSKNIDFNIANSWEIDGAFTFIKSPTTGQGILATDNLTGTQIKVNTGSSSLLWRLTSTKGVSWDIINDQYLFDLSEGVKYYFKCGFTGNQYWFKYKTDEQNEYQTVFTLNSTSKISNGTSRYIIGDRIPGTSSIDGWRGSIDLKQFSITVDGIEVFNGNKTGVDQIKEDNYTVIGSPTITDDGIVSRFDWSNYLTTGSFALSPSKSLDVYVKIHTPASPYNVAILNRIGDENGGLYLGLHPSGYYQLACGSTTQSNIIGWSNCGAIDYDKDVILNFSWDGKQYTLKKSLDNGKTYTTLKAVSSTVAIGSASYLFGQGTAGNNATINLNSFKIYVDGNLVYQPTLRIPYTLSKTGSKIVDTNYRDRVQETYDYTGKALYYVKDDISKDIQLPKGDIYGMITRLHDAIGDINKMLDVINGEQLTSASVAPMMLALEPTELDVEDSFNTSIERATFDCELDITPTEFKPVNYDDTDIDLGGNI